MGGDFIVFQQVDYTRIADLKAHSKIDNIHERQLNQAQLEDVLAEFRGRGIVDQYAFSSIPIDQVLLSDFEIKTAYHSMAVSLCTMDSNHLDVVNHKYLQVREQMQYRDSSLQGETRFEGFRNPIKLLEKVTSDASQTSYQHHEDPFSVQTRGAEEEVTLMNEGEDSEVINIILASGAQSFLNAQVGDAKLKLCIQGTEECFKLRVTQFTDKFPGFAKFSQFLPISYLKPHTLISQSQYKYIFNKVLDFKERRQKVSGGEGLAPLAHIPQ